MTGVQTCALPISKINEEFVRQIPPAKLTRKFFAKKVKCKDLFIVVSSDYNVVYATQNCDAEEKCYLSEYFTKTYITWSYACDECPWDRAQVFDSLGLLAYAYPAYQLLPLSIIQDGKVTEEMLRVLHPIIKEAFCNQKEDLSKYFVEEQVNQKVKKKKKIIE